MQQSVLTFPGFERNVPIMPDEFKGGVKKSCGLTISSPRAWTEKELSWISRLKSSGYSMEDIAKSVGRTIVSISIKMKRIGKVERRYNSDHLEDKYNANEEFFRMVAPLSVLDLYAGEKSWWKENAPGADVFSNDVRKAYRHNFNENAERLVHRLLYEGRKYDLVDLDPFGSAYDCFDCAIKMARKAIVITLGEMGHRRFNRLDFVGRYYGIKDISEFTTSRIIDEICRIGLRNKKELKPVIVKEWKMISRVYFLVSPVKINIKEAM